MDNEKQLKELKNLTLVEMDNIKIHATKDQIERLNKSIANPNLTDKCIYGMMTGNCFNSDAIDLIIKCGCPYNDDLAKIDRDRDAYFNKPGIRVARYFTALEIYISFFSNDIPAIIDYLRGDIQTIEL